MSTNTSTRFLTFLVTVALIAGCTQSVKDLRAAGDVQGLVDRLTSSATTQERVEAATALADLAAEDGPASAAAAEALDHLTIALDDPEPVVRAAAVRGLGGLGVGAACPPILGALTDTSEQVQAAATEALTTIVADLEPAAAIDMLASALVDSNEAVRLAGAWQLGQLGTRPTIVPLLGALGGDSSPAVRTAARTALAKVLEKISPTDAANALLDAADDTSDSVRAAAIEQLGAIGTATAILPLLQATGDPAAAVRTAASKSLADVLGRVSANEAATALIAALRHENEIVRAAAARQLGQYGTTAAIVPLLRALGDSAPSVRDEASAALTEALGRLSEAAAVEVLLGATAEDDEALRDAAGDSLVALLARIGPSRAVDALLAANAPDTWLAVALNVPVSGLSKETRRLGIQLEPLSAIRDAAEAAAAGKAVEGTHRYAASGAFHSAIVVAPSLADEAKATWSPTALRFLELVVTEKAGWSKIQLCRYNGPDITRYRAVVTVKVISAYTGKIVATRTYKGPAPRACRQTEVYSLTRLEGAAPDLGPAITWLNSLIHPPR